jgi:chromate transport protein ChrA
VDLRAPVPARAQFLHAAAGSGGDATGDLCRLAAASDPRRHRRRRAVRPARLRDPSGLSTLYALFRETDWLASVFFGLKAAVLAIVLEAVVRIGRRALKTPAAVVLAAAAFVGIFVLRIPFPAIVLGAGLIGIVGTGLRPGLFADTRHGAEEADDALASPAAPSLAGAGRVVVTWGALWAAPVLIAGLILGWGSIYPALALFFSWMAVVTFGGAYAVLAYVAEAAVASYGWLEPGQMLDGLALAETTPGPLILVLTFVGFVAAFGDPGSLTPLAAGSRRDAGDMGYVRSLLPLDLSLCPVRGNPARQSPPVRRARGDHRRRGRRHSQSGALPRPARPFPRRRRAGARAGPAGVAGLGHARSLGVRADGRSRRSP